MHDYCFINLEQLLQRQFTELESECVEVFWVAIQHTICIWNFHVQSKLFGNRIAQIVRFCHVQ
jgi:hypothetical protein